MPMSNQDITNYYANLLILQYLGKPKAYATIQALVAPVVMSQLPAQVQGAFNLTSGPNGPVAQGVQLDILGKYVGVTRSGYSPQGFPITLNDADFISLLNFAIVKNNSGSSLAAIQNEMQSLFAGAVFVFDYQSMHMSYLIKSTVGTQNLILLLISEGLLPKPMGVSLALVIYAPIIDAFFGFRTYEVPANKVSPFNTYSDYKSGTPWLSYANAI